MIFIHLLPKVLDSKALIRPIFLANDLPLRKKRLFKTLEALKRKKKILKKILYGKQIMKHVITGSFRVFHVYCVAYTQ